MSSFKSIVFLTSWIITLPFLGLGLRYTVQHREFYIMEGKSLIGNVTAVRQVTDLLDCSFLCLEFGPNDCLSFNFEKMAPKPPSTSWGGKCGMREKEALKSSIFI